MGNIVWLASYPKSGNTWLRSFLYNLIEQPDKPGQINNLWQICQDESKPNWYEPYAKDKPLSEFTPAEITKLRMQVHRDIANSQPAGSVFVKTHNMMGAFDNYPLHNLQITAGAIYVVRNPLDVVLSAADHFGISVDEAIDFMANEQTGAMTDEANVAGFFGSWSSHVQSWTGTSDDNICVLRYEDMLDNAQKTFAKVMKFLGMKKDPKALKRAINFSSFRELSAQENKEAFIETSPDAVSKKFFRKGQKNQWLDQLSEEQVERIIDAHREQMMRFKYVPKKYQ